MNSITQVSFGLDLTWLLLALAVAIGFGVIVPLLRRVPESFRLSALLKLAVIVLCVFVFVKWSRTLSLVHGPQVQEIQFGRSFGTTPLIPPAPEETSSTRSTSASDVPTDETGTQLPDWTKQTRRVDGSHTLLVVKSGRFATSDEAKLHANQAAAKAVALEFRHLDPQGIGDANSQHADEIQRSAIKRNFLEVAETDYGQFKGPSYQQWVELELTPELGDRLAAPWRQSAVDSRLRMLTGWGIWMTCVAGLASFALRLDAAWNGRHRAMLTLAALVAAAGGLAFLA